MTMTFSRETHITDWDMDEITDVLEFLDIPSKGWDYAVMDFGTIVVTKLSTGRTWSLNTDYDVGCLKDYLEFGF